MSSPKPTSTEGRAATSAAWFWYLFLRTFEETQVIKFIKLLELAKKFNRDEYSLLPLLEYFQSNKIEIYIMTIELYYYSNNYTWVKLAHFINVITWVRKKHNLNLKIIFEKLNNNIFNILAIYHNQETAARAPLGSSHVIKKINKKDGSEQILQSFIDDCKNKPVSLIEYSSIDNIESYLTPLNPDDLQLLISNLRSEISDFVDEDYIPICEKDSLPSIQLINVNEKKINLNIMYVKSNDYAKILQNRKQFSQLSNWLPKSKLNYWVKKDYWDHRQATCLIQGIDPDLVIKWHWDYSSQKKGWYYLEYSQIELFPYISDLKQESKRIETWCLAKGSEYIAPINLIVRLLNYKDFVYPSLLSMFLDRYNADQKLKEPVQEPDKNKSNNLENIELSNSSVQEVERNETIEKPSTNNFYNLLKELRETPPLRTKPEVLEIILDVGMALKEDSKPLTTSHFIAWFENNGFTGRSEPYQARNECKVYISKEGEGKEYSAANTQLMYKTNEDKTYKVIRMKTLNNNYFKFIRSLLETPIDEPA